MPIAVPLRKIRYLATPSESVEALHFKRTYSGDGEVAERPVGTVGGVASAVMDMDSVLLMELPAEHSAVQRNKVPFSEMVPLRSIEDSVVP